MSTDELPVAGPRPAVRIGRLILTSLAIVALIGAAAGFWGAHRNHGGGGLTTPAIVVIALWAIAVACLLIPVIRDVRALSDAAKRVPRRESASLKWVALAFAAGAAGGVVTVVSQQTGWLTDGRGNLSPVLAIGTALLLATVAPWMTWRWWREIDEHEQSAYVEGANIAGHFTLLVGIGWWVLSRAKLVPEPDVMVLVIAMSFVWTGVWFYRRYF